MSDGSLRRDPFTGRFSVCTSRRKGMSRAPIGGPPIIEGPCPFCPGNEAETEAAVAELVDAGGRWTVRVVKNRYPWVKDEPFGRHEVVIETPRHDADLCDLEDAEVALVLRAYRDRVRALEASPGIAHVALFRNYGRLAGSSQPHPHGQLLACGFVGPEVETREALAAASFAADGRSLLDRVLEEELASGERVVAADDRWVVLCPVAPQTSDHVMIAPRAGGGSFGAAPDALVDALAPVLSRTLGALRQVTARRDYNTVFRQPPVGAGPGSFFCIDIIPRRTAGAGYELSSGNALVTVFPEETAAALRAVRFL